MHLNDGFFWFRRLQCRRTECAAPSPLWALSRELSTRRRIDTLVGSNTAQGRAAMAAALYHAAEGVGVVRRRDRGAARDGTIRGEPAPSDGSASMGPIMTRRRRRRTTPPPPLLALCFVLAAAAMPPAVVGECMNTVQGRHYLADDQVHTGTPTAQRTS